MSDKNGFSYFLSARFWVLKFSHRGFFRDMITYVYPFFLPLLTESREQIRNQKHLSLREAVSSNDETLTLLLLENIGPERELIVNLAPSGANTLLFMYELNFNIQIF